MQSTPNEVNHLVHILPDSDELWRRKFRRGPNIWGQRDKRRIMQLRETRCATVDKAHRRPLDLPSSTEPPLCKRVGDLRVNADIAIPGQKFNSVPDFRCVPNKLYREESRRLWTPEIFSGN